MLNLFLKKFSIVFVVLSVFLSSHCFGNSNVKECPFPYRHHIRFGPEFILYKQNKQIKNITSKGTSVLSIKFVK